MSYPSNMSQKGIVDWATYVDPSSSHADGTGVYGNGINASLLEGKNWDDVENTVVSIIQPLTEAEMTALLAKWN